MWRRWLVRRGCHAAAAATTAVALCARVRRVVHVVDASTFEQEVMQSQQAICLVYHIPSSNNCVAYLRTAEQLIDAINATTTTAVDDATSADGTSNSTTTTTTTTRPNAWLKLCSINADANRNLASAFAVERAKLPVTYFIMQATIVDKLVGHVPAARLQSILHAFLEHYQRELNVNFLRQSPGSSGSGGDSAAALLPHAATADLMHGTSTAFLRDKLLTALVGAERIRLPEEASQLDGMRKTLQQAKRKADEEVAALRTRLGMHIRRLDDVELQSRYYAAAEYQSLAMLTALEALYLARCYAEVGDVARTHVVWARRGLQRDFAPALAHAALRRVVAVVDACALKGDLRVAHVQLARDAERVVVGGAGDNDDAAVSTQDADDTRTLLMAQQQCYAELTRVLDAHVDARTVSGGDGGGSAFPDAVAEQLVVQLKDSMRLARQGSSNSSNNKEKDEQQQQQQQTTAMTTSERRVALARERAEHIRAVLMCLVQYYSDDAHAHALRARLSSLLY